MVDFSKYQPPGLYTEAVPGPQLAVQSTTPTSVGLFGLAVGYRREVESLVIDPDTQNADNSFSPAINRTLKQPGIRTDSVVVRNPNSGEAYTLNTDYTLYKVSGGGSATSTRDDLYTVQRVTDGAIDQGDVVEVSYTYTDPEYFSAKTFYDFDDVRDQYGPAFDNLGNIQSELTLAASLAFQNGAYSVVTSAVDPVDPDTPTLADYQGALDRLRDEANVSVVVPATGMQQIHQTVISHVNQQSSNRFERRAIVARDGSGSTVTSANLISDANAINSNRVALVAPASMRYFAPELNREILLGGQFLAAAVAGISVSQNAAVPLTRHNVRGFVGVGAKTEEGERNLQSQNGLMVIEETRRGRIQIRHGVTTDFTNILTREWNIIGQQDSMLYRLREYLDNDHLIGGIIDELTMANVKASADAALQSLVMDHVIRGYQDLKVRQVETQPDVLEIRFAWQPSMPLNYIVVRYSVSIGDGAESTLQSI